MPVMNSEGMPDVRATKERCRNTVRLIGREPVEESQLTQAFEDAVWFWEHALEHQPSMSGVRKSFFLSSFIKLASAYPPADQYIEAQIVALADKLQQGSIDARGYGDLAALRRSLGRMDDMAVQLRQFIHTQPVLAAKVGPWNWREWIEVEAWDLFESYHPEPEELVSQWVDTLESSKPKEGAVNWLMRWEVMHKHYKNAFRKTHRAYNQVGLDTFAKQLARLEKEFMKTFDGIVET